jgi:serine/threonine protein kinase
MFRAGDTLGPYTLVRKIGRGQFGVVWLAEKRSAIATTQFALKLPLDEDIDIEAIKQEAALWSHVSGHPNILPIIEADIYEEQIVIASEYAPDGSLADWLKAHGGRGVSVKAATDMISGILAGLERLHSKQIIHRDLKPRNILLQGETPRLADFGLARLLRADGQSSFIAGTPAYMAPEAFRGVRSEQTDLWSAAIIFYEMLVGRLPYAQQDTETLAWAIINTDPEPLPAQLAHPLRVVLIRALEKDPARRYKSASEMRAALVDAGQRVMAVEQQATMISVSNKDAFTTQRETSDDEMTRRVGRSSKLPPERVRQLMIEGAQAFGVGHFAVAVEKWEEVLRLSPDEPGIRESLESAKQRLRELQRGLHFGAQTNNGARPAGYNEAAPGSADWRGAGTGAQMQPAPRQSQSDSQRAWAGLAAQQAEHQAGQYSYHSSSQQVLPGQRAAARSRWLRTILVGLAILLAVGGALAAVFYFRVFDAKRTFVVAKDNSGDYRTIGEALKNLPAGARILVRAGTYSESLLIDKEIEIAAEPSGGAIIESQDAPCVTIKTDQATVRGLVLRGRAAEKGGRQFAVDIPQGRALIENCNITSDSLAAVAVYGAATTPTIRGTTIHDGLGPGISFYDRAQGTVEDCDITANVSAGVEIKEGANPTIRNSRIHNGKSNGLLVSASGIGVIENCDIYRNAASDVAITSGGNPVFRGGRVHDGKSSAVLVYAGGNGTFDGVEIFAAGSMGTDEPSNVEIKESSNPIFRGCRIRDGRGAGVHISKNSQGTIEACEIHGNGGPGVQIEASNPAVRRSKIYDSAGPGIQILDGSAANVEETEIYRSGSAGIEIETSSAVVRRCAVRNGNADGIVIDDSGRVTIDDSDVTDNVGSGVVLNSECRINMKESRVNRNSLYAVWVDTSTAGSVTGCDLSGNESGAWYYNGLINNMTFSSINREGNAD